MPLILSRKIGEAIVINHQTTVRVVEFMQGRVKLSIDAPGSVPIHREEVELAIMGGDAKEAG